MPKVGVFAAIFDEKDRILCVKLNYGSGNWTLPGGNLEKYESPIEGVKREVLEETGYIIDIISFVSVYSAPQKNDLVLLFKGKIVGQTAWQPNEEIQGTGFFEKDRLPEQMHPWNVRRIQDAFENQSSILRVFEGT